MGIEGGKVWEIEVFSGFFGKKGLGQRTYVRHSVDETP